MRLIPLVKGMKLYCRRAINAGGKNYLEGQELPYKHLSLSWRLVLRLYEQRRVVSKNDSYFQELMQIHGLKNNLDFAKPWLEENGAKEKKKAAKENGVKEKKEVVKKQTPKPKKSRSRKKK